MTGTDIQNALNEFGDFMPSKEELAELSARDYEYDKETTLLAKWMFAGNKMDDKLLTQCIQVSLLPENCVF